MGAVQSLTPTSQIETQVERFCIRKAGANPGDLILTAFSGGADSCALLLALLRRQASHGLRVQAVHIDHGLDGNSADRAQRALRLAADLGISATLRRVPWRPGPGESLEASARVHRYRLLQQAAEEQGARFIATAHHADDQAETVLLRLLFGSGLDGLAGIAPQRGRVIRPLLSVRRCDLIAYLKTHGVVWIQDPTNTDLRIPRNALRHRLLPHLETVESGDMVAPLVRVAERVRQARPVLEKVLRKHLNPRPDAVTSSWFVERTALHSLPTELRPHALAYLHRLAGATYPPPISAAVELWKQLARDGGIGCDCGREWRWEGAGSRLHLLPAQPEPPNFAYTVQMSGKVEVPELDLRVRLKRCGIESWMFRRHADRVGLFVPDAETPVMTVRKRRPGDRMRPLGRRHHVKLKELFNKRRIPRSARSRLPLLLIDGEIAWIPGVAVAERFRIRDASSPVVKVTIEPLENPKSGLRIEHGSPPSF